MTFNVKLVNLRKIKGITQDEFAKAVGVSRQSVYKWEAGISYPEVAKLVEIKLLFGISIDDLLDDSYEVTLPEKKRRRKKAEAVVTEEKTADSVNEIVNEAKEEPAIEPIEDVKAEETVEKVEEKTEEKKVGFFGRLFGRR
jgi:transcriptional regulator with XRE-family HTH domain